MHSSLDSEMGRSFARSIAQGMSPAVRANTQNNVRPSGTSSVKSHELWLKVLAVEARRSIENVGGPLSPGEHRAYDAHLDQVHRDALDATRREFYTETIPSRLVKTFQTALMVS